MKRTKRIMILGFMTLFSYTTFAQDNCVSEGKFIVDAYYGYPFLVGTWLKQASTGALVKVNNTNHLGIKFEYMVNDKIGVGFDYTYAKVMVHETNITSKSGAQQVTYYGVYWASFTKQRFLLRMNVHFATSDKIDPYAAFGVGFKQAVYKDNYPDTYDNDFNAALNLVPVAFRMGIGMRYFFSENVGINIEAGIGGPVMQGGLSFKF